MNLQNVILLLAGICCTLTFYLIFYFILYRKNVLQRLAGKKDIKVDKSLELKLMLKKTSVKRRGLLGELEKRLSEASIEMDINKFLKICAALCVVLPGLTILLTGSIVFSISVLVVIPLIINIVLNYLKRKRVSLFLEQLPDVIDFLSSSLKSGYSLMQAIDLIATEGIPPASLEFNRVIQDINMGKTYEEALDKLVDRNPGEDIEILVSAILISKETGGNLTFILDTVSSTIREKERIVGEIKSLSAQGRLSGVVLMLLPIAVFAFMALTNPAYIKPLFTDPVGKMMLGGAIFSQIIGAVIIKKLVKIDW